MERIIKFKAKRRDNDKWVEGDLLQHKDGVVEIGVESFSYIENEVRFYEYNKIFEVAPATVCQFTGLRDRNGKEIWEHDLLVKSSLTDSFELKWNSNHCYYSLYIPGTNALVEYNFTEYPVNNYKVVGNVFDRKEGGK